MAGAYQRVSSKGRKTSDWDGIVSQSALFTSLAYGMAYQLEQEAKADWAKLGLFTVGVIGTAGISGFIFNGNPVYGIIIILASILAMGLALPTAAIWRSRVRIKLWDDARKS